MFGNRKQRRTSTGIESVSSLMMVSCFPSTPKKLAQTVVFFLAGASLFAVGVHLSYVNIAPQQARTKARNDFVKERLRQKYGEKYGKYKVFGALSLQSLQNVIGMGNVMLCEYHQVRHTVDFYSEIQQV
ncbi:unnamed protein product [Camellia sinensis]